MRLEANGAADTQRSAAARVAHEVARHLQDRAGRVSRPQTVTHGTSRRRVRAVAAGHRKGQGTACDTVAASRL